MVRRKPQTLEGMRTVNGMGEIKTAKYGQAFLNVICTYVQQERRMKADVKALAERAQSAAFRMSGGAAQKPKPAVMPPTARVGASQNPPEPITPRMPEIDWEKLCDNEVLADAYLSGISIQQMAQRSGYSEEYLREKLRNLDLIF